MKKFDSILKKTSEIKDFQSFDVDVEWNKLAELLINTTPTDKDGGPKEAYSANESDLQIIYLLAFAAAMILFFSAIFLFRKPEVFKAELLTKSEIKSIELKDGTKIRVGPESSLQYYTSLHNQNFRDVKLNGTATFEVARSILPFKVHYQDVLVEVLGTSFSLDKNKDTIIIKNIAGSFRVSELKNLNNFKILNKGEKFHFIDGNFLNPDEPVNLVSKVQPPTQKTTTQNSRKEQTTDTPAKVRRFTLESVIKSYLIKFNKKKIKLDKKSKPDLTLVVTIDDINKPYLELLEDLKKQGVIDFVSGDCSDCYIIKAPQKK